MLTDKDIKKLSSVFATKAEVVTKSEFAEFKSEFAEFKSELFTILDGIAKSIEDLKIEYVAIKVQLDRHDRWIKEIADKTGVKLDDKF
ncbi:MAG: hypothetical protein A3G52_00095 [Candidatus Taylorbacteria bacterium RIFCSPLOWO2_12_FULL_43_20]|uniref:Uncharacterized protein n=1 Tax=Candidatus Taylorbacteria bacterium RIFCSPLOWO2_12_FULL_43_20 TaxID=1802332 RepID=A0A1G2P2V4_9BACT|nr:MAG: hypothetical protein A2825_03150 [Candidatus Taylorbacteria bacterium RIFCSPHIGHO2_01_FULL_43_120]OHA22961.1 MAG: hypothetical protein A3B98_02885 [Candidatus Taylorbacteria bacterium RIFCSPHIGHO2_02_FULL_43_55]OHA30199.1 MAG: hypothetical protein A3E92_01250 [Candidatus Taylorbacteria bacterium RIFCSPHIGHO2_12_FULL_42_34]OHA31947.1 MAG: hypothetical protein A3B09_01005 [Candidatus Taylorbacteria bacterium RIFCSPLOWO2_01_FULL_43_83]OHA37970.1 MAG: hypothetical protein A3H58_01420 [Candi